MSEISYFEKLAINDDVIRLAAGKAAPEARGCGLALRVCCASHGRFIFCIPSPVRGLRLLYRLNVPVKLLGGPSGSN
jgi:hypothetical protein